MSDNQTTSQAESPAENRKAFVDPATMPSYQTKRMTVPAAEALLGVPLRCLDRGFVRLVDYMGSDARIVQSARVSYGEGTKTRSTDAGLIDYLIRNAHTSPIEQVETVTHWKLPIFLARQFVRTRTAKLNEESARYSILSNEFWVPDVEDLRVQSTDNKQGSGEPIAPTVARKILEAIVREQQSSYSLYEELLRGGLSREVARTVLHVGIYTEWYWKIDLHNLIRMLGLRDHPHAQRQAQVYARAMKEIVRAVAPMTYAAADKHVWGAVSYSRDERLALAAMLKGEPAGLDGAARKRFEAKLFAEVRPNPRELSIAELGLDPVASQALAKAVDGDGLVEDFTREDLRRLLGAELAESSFKRIEAAGLVLRGW